ncbi:DUF4405 domain-containing protein [Rhizobium sp. NPDC090275]|uniref:DUF4405 domain-containing protein n=1 Tax=Rhizobium sp. NPDC090275 TaxID=3364498 RepID=UPI00383BB608
MAGLLLLCLAYWWLDNLAHEIFGTAMFLILARHIYQNRSWFRNLTRGPYGVRRTVIVAFHVALAVNMIVLLVTSLAISQSLFAKLPLPDSATLSELHWFSAYWVIIAVGCHLGLHWPRIRAFINAAFNLPPATVLQTRLLLLLAAILFVIGFASLSTLDIATKLSFRLSPNFWDFSTSVTPFFVRWVGVMALPAIATHCVVNIAGRRRASSRNSRA